MNLQKHIQNLAILGENLADIVASPQNYPEFELAQRQNGWFTSEAILFCLNEWHNALTAKNLSEWMLTYSQNRNTKPYTVGLVLAGNIPLVGLHDIICVLITGNKVLAKLSHKDNALYQLIYRLLIQIDEEYAHLLIFTEKPFTNIDAIIATGSNNSSRYFDYYYGKYPNIIRRNRNSVAIIEPNITIEDINKLSNDIFLYFGMGCRNVSYLLIPNDFNIDLFYQGIAKFKNISDHHKYNNNYSYQQTILAMNKIPFFDNGFCLLTENDSLASPISTLHIKYYKNEDQIEQFINANKHNIQCIVSTTKHKFKTYFYGEAQKPALNDYADGIDTIEFLLNLNTGV